MTTTDVRLHSRPAARWAGLLLVVMLTLVSGCRRAQQPAPQLPPLPPGELAVRLLVLHGSDGTALALVPVWINGQGPFRFALDTGASHTLIDRGLAQRLGLPIEQGTVKVSGIAAVSEATPVRVEQWRVGDVALPPRTLVTLQLPSEDQSLELRGLLGSDILSRFGAVRIDYDRQVLIFRPGQEEKRQTAPADSDGQ
jgi:hypothetical protein